MTGEIIAKPFCVMVDGVRRGCPGSNSEGMTLRTVGIPVQGVLFQLINRMQNNPYRW